MQQQPLVKVAQNNVSDIRKAILRCAREKSRSIQSAELQEQEEDRLNTTLLEMQDLVRDKRVLSASALTAEYLPLLQNPSYFPLQSQEQVCTTANATKLSLVGVASFCDMRTQLAEVCRTYPRCLKCDVGLQIFSWMFARYITPEKFPGNSVVMTSQISRLIWRSCLFWRSSPPPLVAGGRSGRQVERTCPTHVTW